MPIAPVNGAVVVGAGSSCRSFAAQKLAAIVESGCSLGMAAAAPSLMMAIKINLHAPAAGEGGDVPN